MKLILLMWPYVGQEEPGHFNSRNIQGKYFCEHCLFFHDNEFCTAAAGHEINRYVCVKFKNYKLKKL